MRTLGLGQGLEPIGNLVETFFPSRLGHTRIHVGVLMGLAGDGGLEVFRSGADGQTGGGIADFFQVFQMAVGMAGFTLRRGTEHRRHVVVAFHVRLGGEIKITAVRLRFAGEGGLQILFGFAVFECHCDSSLRWFKFVLAPAGKARV